MAATGKLNGHIEEMYTGHALIKAFGQRHAAEATFAAHNDALFSSSFKAQFLSGLIQPAMTFIGNINYVFIAVIGGLRVASGQLSLGDVQAFIQYSRQFSQPISQVASMANLLQSGVASAERVFALLDADEQEPDSVDARSSSPSCTAGSPSNTSTSPTPPTSRSSPTCRSRSTRADGRDRRSDRSGEDDPRQPLDALLRGRLGSHHPRRRRHRLDDARGAALQDGNGAPRHLALQRDHRREHRLRRAGGDEAAVVAAAQSTHVDHFVRTLPDGYETVLDEEASSVSAGERQLITIARAFLAEPAILILDEATSSVDTRTEVLIQRAMNALRHGADELCDRAPPLDDPRCRSHLGDGGGADRRAGDPRGAARRGRRLRPPVRGAVRERDRRVRALPVLPWAKRARCLVDP